MELTEEEFGAANARGVAQKASFPLVSAARYDRRVSRVVISFASGLDVSFAPRQVQGLERARPADLAVIEISPSGLGLHFPSLDADVHIPALLEGFFGSRSCMASEIGKRGGASTSEAKVAASKRNGRLGGRPRKPTPEAA
jgi:hypothetical protein